MTARVPKPEEYFIEKEPYYEPIGDEIEVLETAYRQKLPVLLKGARSGDTWSRAAKLPG